MKIAAQQYGFSDFRKAYEGERMAPPRAKVPEGYSLGSQRIKGFDYDIPVAVDATGAIDWNSAVCAPSGVGMRVTPKWGAANRTHSGPDHRSLTTIEGRADMSTLRDNT